MTCKQCKYITVCMAQADGLGQVFDPNYDGEHGCTDFVPFTNADRIRSMTDEELALWICGVYDIEEENGKFINGIIIPGYTPNDIEEWLQQPAEEEADNEAD